ncbi:molybdenum cofactor guanylyltransferase [Clostridium pasteurianum DSM 525 = ATCC 6013]|jgi:molybdopterin-guanine dinucleotide biosynthesis protein A|uniref:Probable molybdenum cofactor guanylyltransferase n=1 Tax=Clostridium pasteurianum DSM 525 = ATCC 6013 TaxID=1262449 RepID=A0A0H3IZZ8_CLOPA|nr:molybdenum cofactor guanylyltransferase [Clostridium pasteurianum]AJA47131.1 molybdenum cofactor guanylyltransferase [Clostridium pasteurianum DSM 525 = ATCC 6013]AJA51119.1 molybdenum cofactor guanylyltransferase [Clostridium pasteurianum DSM 525 = ATCC 6013]AOZ74492.1 molybdenum cofactor guanylyltransferase [Clostridium pasteurianum DSM 525 = ATCC 6013]AOZ78289.1 molybdenum cofactor guanylyltransferase [Clostridium pasteurianum]ELP59480.1 formate dehydrogenase accessory protein FdhD [Clos
MDRFKTAVILAGGKSSRMGFDKQFLKIGEKRLMDILINEIKEEFQDIIIVTNKPKEYKSLYKSCRIVSDEIESQGPLSGIHIGLKESKSKYAYFIACDMPKVNIPYIRYMKEELIKTDADACVTEAGCRMQPFNAFYSKEVFYKIEDLLREGKRSMFSFINIINTHFIDEDTAKKYNKDFNMFFNLNTPEDLKDFQVKLYNPKNMDKNIEK